MPSILYVTQKENGAISGAGNDGGGFLVIPSLTFSFYSFYTSSSRSFDALLIFSYSTSDNRVSWYNKNSSYRGSCAGG